MNKDDLVKKVDKTIVDYINGHRIENGILVPVTGRKEIKMPATKRFHNCLHILLGLSKCQRLLMDWLAEEMDDDNMIVHDEHMRRKFINFIASIQVEGKVLKYEDQTVANAFNDIVKRQDLLKKLAKSRYRLNPEYYWRGSDKDRIDAIMMMIEFNEGKGNFRVINKSQDYTYVKRSLLDKRK